MKCLPVFFTLIGTATAAYVSNQMNLVNLNDFKPHFQYCHYNYKSECFFTNKTFTLKTCKTVPLARYMGVIIINAELHRMVTKPRVS
jgi:hypothetical protein